jgi:formate hydrogenlyase subunit 3/multisubunit Na+/H+ antiporter MnhD subunit
LVLGKNIVNFGIKLVSSLAVLAIVIGGILILTARGSVNQATIGKKLIHYAIIGVVIALASWTIINLVIGFLAKPKIFLFPWDEIDCPR